MYRDAWQTWLLTTRQRDPGGVLERVMDETAPMIAYNPADPRWQSFVKTLPGFSEYWERMKVQ